MARGAENMYFPLANLTTSHRDRAHTRAPDVTVPTRLARRLFPSGRDVRPREISASKHSPRGGGDKIQQARIHPGVVTKTTQTLRYCIGSQRGSGYEYEAGHLRRAGV